MDKFKAGDKVQWPNGDQYEGTIRKGPYTVKEIHSPAYIVDFLNGPTQLIGEGVLEPIESGTPWTCHWGHSGTSIKMATVETTLEDGSTERICQNYRSRCDDG